MENPPPIDLEFESKTYRRIPVGTHVLGPEDTPIEVVERYVVPLSQPSDVVFISETSVAIMQNRHRDHREITPGWLARKLSALVTKSPYGVGLRSPYAMQYAIELAGVPRILAGCAAHVFGRVLGKKRWFYDVAGIQVRMMDAEHTMGVKEYYECVIPGPAAPGKVCSEVKQATGLDCAIVDVNDIFPPWCIAGTVDNEQAALLEATLTDNPLGQGDELTPLGIWRKV